MPYPSQIDAEAVVQAATAYIGAHGIDKLSLSKVAAELGVKAPSLYRYFDGKAGLLRAVNTNTTVRLFAALDAATVEGAPADEQLQQVATAYRAFALANAAVYGLLFTNTIDDLRPDEDENAQLALPYQALMAQVIGDETVALAALRGLLGLIHGYAMLEIAGQLRRGGDLEAHYEQAVRAYIDGWQARRGGRV